MKQSPRELLAGIDPAFDPEAVEIDDSDVLARLHPAVREWWVEEFGEHVPENGGFFTPPQKDAIPLIQDDANPLICAPTGSGKTLASFCAIIDELYRREATTPQGLENEVYCIYISPLKSLANDIHRNLAVPLEGISTTMASFRDEMDVSDIEIRHAIRHGDTDERERQGMLDETPHILNTTPETLAILLNAPKFREKLRSVEYVIVDEIHALAGSKRGTHLSVSLERLEALTTESPTRIGCSATVEPLDEMAEFLVGREQPGGSPREYEIVDARFAREFDLKLECPTDDLIGTDRDVIQRELYDRLHQLIQEHTNTLVFTNTRSGAERVLYNLRERYPEAYAGENSGCHHGSLSKAHRQEIESKLKQGNIDVVTTSTSLELGIDMPHVDHVIQLGSPKSVASLLQRVGRAGHQLGQTVEGRVLVLERDELIECTVMVKKATEGFVDSVHIPENAHDVATQHVYGMAIADLRPEVEVKGILRRSYPFRTYTDTEWEHLCRYLTGDYDGLEEQDVYPKIWRDENDPPHGEHHYEEFDVGEPLIGKRGRMARMIYMTNIGTIPDSFTCEVFTRSEKEWVGSLDEDYLDTLDPGDVFVLGGNHFEYTYRRGTNVYAEPTTARPTVPSWFSERMPLSYDLAEEILAFQQSLLERFDRGGRGAVRNWLRKYPIDENTVRVLAEIIDDQVAYAGAESLSTDERIAIESVRDQDAYRRHYYVHTCYGRKFNDGLSRLLAYHCSRRTGADVQVAVTDNGFTVSMPLDRKVDVADVIQSIRPKDIRTDLRAALDGTDLKQRYFRINATRSLLILKRYKGYEKSAPEQQVASEMLLSFVENLEDFVVIEETYREILEDKLHVSAIETIVESIREGSIDITKQSLPSPSPRAFGMATLAASDAVLVEDESQLLRKFDARVTDAIEKGGIDTIGVE